MSTSQAKFTEPVALVNGAGAGINRAKALGFARGGTSLIITDMSEKNGQDTTCPIEEIV